MLINIRCISCSKVLANKWYAYLKKVQEQEASGKEDEGKGKILEELGITKMCCKRHMLTHIDIFEYL